MAHNRNDDDDRADALIPGAVGGIENIVELAFGVPMTPTLTRADVLKRVTATLAQRGVQYEQLYISEMPVNRGGLFNARGRRVQFPEGEQYDRCFVVLVDPDTHARWAHPAHWAFVPVGGRGDIQLVATNLPHNNRGSVRFVVGPPTSEP